MSRRSQLLSLPGRLRWRRVVLGARIRARLAGHHLRINSGDDVRAGRDVRIDIRGGPTRIEVGDGCRFHDHVLVDSTGGEIVLGSDVELRPGVTLRVGHGGRLRLDGQNMLSYGTIVHVAGEVHLADRVTAAEYVTIIDSDHGAGGVTGNFRDTRQVVPVSVGPNTWLGAKSTITAGVRVGARAVVAANAVVVRDVEEGAIVGGVPARPITSSASGDADG